MEFFAGANTKQGFFSLFDEVFRDSQRLYILKGSSGCGKSTFMKRIAKKAEEKKLDYHLIFCSADPSSLDGIIIPRLGVAIADGTHPHVLDVKYPCVRESIINLGQFWEKSKLLSRRAEIMGLTDLKGCHYKNAYRALSAAGTVEALEDEIFNQSLDRKRLDNFAFKFAEKLFVSHGERKNIFPSAFTCEGEKSICVSKEIKTLYTANGKGGKAFLRALQEIAAEKNLSAIIGLNWLDPRLADLIYIPETQTAVSCISDYRCEGSTKIHTVSIDRFINKNSLSLAKNRLKGLGKLKKQLLEEARGELFSAKETHNEIENIYIPAMNFDLMNEFTDSFIKNLFGE
ncbi:MAG: hypothetical protein E7586_01100 [Ruminococcaceae bacterium]|nr:hypothetical protein [Oscillospiraceae bacterium]